MRVLRTFGIGVVAFLLASPAAFADVKLSMKDGKVTLVAKDVTVKQILTEWARIGQTKIVNLERIPGGPLTLELVDVPEAQALDVLLRSVAGYMAAPRSAGAANLSTFDRIVVMPTSTAPRASAGPSTPTFQQPQFAQPPMPADDDDDLRPAAPSNVVPNQVRGPIFNTVPQPQVVNPQIGPGGQPFVPGAQGGVGQPPIVQQVMPQPGAGQQQPGVAGQPQAPAGQQPPAAFPGAPSAPYGGVAVPGMVAPAPPPQPPTSPGQTQRPTTGRGGR
ncbi:MAG: hypothetical protein LAO77_02170 [Acidobacteriia bacterium]|nr:hypothetical protein [Terriglobia bacterium]